MRLSHPLVALRLAAAVLAVLYIDAAAARATDFPYEKELLMDVSPMKGSKRVPSVEVDSAGIATFDLWCTSFKARITVTGDNAAIEFVEKLQAQNACTPERSSADEAIVTTLTQATSWHRQGGILVLEGGGQSLRFRGATN